jgi:hypothetical protein
VAETTSTWCSESTPESDRAAFACQTIARGSRDDVRRSIVFSFLGAIALLPSSKIHRSFAQVSGFKDTGQ